MAMARNKSAMTKFFVGSGCCPLKMRNANPAVKAAKINTLMDDAPSRLHSNSLRARRRRIFREARPRLTNRLCRKKSNILLKRRAQRRSMLLVSIDDGAHQLVANDIALGEIDCRDSGRSEERRVGKECRSQRSAYALKQ